MFKKELMVLAVFIVVFIGIRSVNYIYHLNWSGDQGSFATQALNIFRTRTPTLIGPEISATLNGRFIFQGPLIYYFFIFFLFIGGWNPVTASYLFMIFCSLMIIPLYYGVKKLINQKAALIIIVIYTLVPYYLNYTRFLWNTTLQLSLLPILILLMGLFKEKKQWTYLFLTAIWLGVLLQFHYQFILVIFGIFLYYFIFKKLSIFYILFFIFGLIIGFSPIILFELKHNFYNLQTMIMFVKNWDKVNKPGNAAMPHYYIALSFMGILGISGIFRERMKKFPSYVIFFSALFIGIYALIINVSKPKAAFWAPTSPWNYLAEKKIYDIIRATGMKKDFNIANLAYYDTKSVVVKYFMKRDSYQIDYEDYYHNKYLFVVTEGNKYLQTLSYEVAFFKPNKILNKWKINDRYDMLLLERI